MRGHDGLQLIHDDLVPAFRTEFEMLGWKDEWIDLGGPVELAWRYAVAQTFRERTNEELDMIAVSLEQNQWN